jgi:predicted CXXCH cytochrome family protein
MRLRSIAIAFACAALPPLQVCSAVEKSPCATCHPKETALYSKSAMGTSLIPPEPLPPARITHDLSQSVITSQQRDGQMVHGISERGLTAEYPVRYQIGGKLMGRTYMVQVGDYMFESPASYFKRYGWDLSPGYATKPIIDFDRPVDDACLFCHAGSAQFTDPDGHRLKDTQLTSITCERCHGPSEAHVRRPSSANILNPAKLPHAERDSVCEQCHLEGSTRILNVGKQWTDFRAGQPAESVFATYILSGGMHTAINAVNHVEQLGQSKCVRASGGKLWCGSCHDPHGITVNRQSEIKAVCISCHATLSAASHPKALDECTGCHMPSSATTDIPHAARTDHRLLRRPSEAANSRPAGPEKVIAWREPPVESRRRDLGLAEVLVGVSNNLPQIASDGLHLLKALPEKQTQQDPAVLSDFEGLALQQHDAQEAVKLGREAVKLQPRSAKAAMNLGIVFSRSGDPAEAETQLTHAITLDPSLKQAYIELAKLYAGQDRTQDLNRTLDQFLKFNPQDIMFRLQKQRLQTQ